MNKQKRCLGKVIGDNWFLFKLCFRADPKYMILRILETIRNEIVIFLEFTVSLNYVLECAEFGKPFKEVALLLVGLLMFVVLGLLYASYVSQKLQMKAVPKMKQFINELLYQKAKEIDLACYDDPEFYNDYVLAVSESGNQVDRLFTMMSALFMGLTNIVLSGVFFLETDPISFAFVIISFAVTLGAGKALYALNVKIRTTKIPLERKLEYVNRIFYLEDYAKELRLNSEVSDELLEDYEQINDDILAVDKRNAGKRFGLQFFQDYIGDFFLMNVAYMIYLVYNAVVLHRISYSDVVVLQSAANRMRDRMRLFSEVYPKMHEIGLYVEKMKNFLQIKPTVVSEGTKFLPEHPGEIELRNVSFGYNAQDGFILKNVSMKIEPYSKTAIVGYNGAGKTTLIKLIMRLYDPCEGEILLDGVNIKEYSLEEYRKKIGTVFQDFKIFAATVKENVLQDFADRGSDEEVKGALEKSGFAERLKSFADGLNTNLTTEFEKDGVNLSGGEGQKLAVARVFYKDAILIILDEPSSALDPIAEYHLNQSMMTVAEKKSVVFISHRLSTTRIADRIYMLENGRIIEEGNHENLLALGGKYEEMWKVQAEQYV